jgi:hypothetical protein
MDERSDWERRFADLLERRSPRGWNVRRRLVLTAAVLCIALQVTAVVLKETRGLDAFDGDGSWLGLIALLLVWLWHQMGLLQGATERHWRERSP